MGGARGDFGLGLSLYILILLVSRSAYSLVALVIFTVLVFYTIYSVGLSDNIHILERFLYTYRTGDLGERDLLFEKSINLLADNMSCLVFGCGFNYFQYYFSYNFGLYPHNLVLEFIITFGIFPLLPIILMAFRGISIIIKENRVDKFLLYFTLYVFLVSLKSGSLISFMAIPVILFYSFIPYFYKSIK
jgi:O-antigen ligase